jgi:hypothetical protein
MALGLVYGGGGNITPFCKYDARSGKIFRVDRVLKNGQYVNDPVEITTSFKAAMDLENIERGFINFTGKAPQYVLVPLDAQMPPKPQGDGWKQGVRAMMKLGKDCGDDVREITSNAEAFLKGLDALHDQYEREKHNNLGKLPVVALLGTEKVTGNKSTNHMPVLGIIAWTTRPADFVFVPKAAQDDDGGQPDEEY